MQKDEEREHEKDDGDECPCLTAILLYYLGTYVRLGHASLGAQPST